MPRADYTYRIEEVYDKRLGQVIYELYSTYCPTGSSSLIGEYSTRNEAREGMIRQRDRDTKKKEVK